MSMTSGSNKLFHTRKAFQSDLDSIKQLADQHRKELGFVMRPSLQKSIEQEEIFVTILENEMVGFVHYHHRRDQQTTLYHIAVSPRHRCLGIGKDLINHLRDEAIKQQKLLITLKCPIVLPANEFYKRYGLSLVRVETGKAQPLNVWTLMLSQ